MRPSPGTNLWGSHIHGAQSCEVAQVARMGSRGSVACRSLNCFNACIHELRVRCGNNGLCFLEVAVLIRLRLSLIMMIHGQSCLATLLPHVVVELFFYDSGFFLPPEASGGHGFAGGLSSHSWRFLDFFFK